MGHHRWRGYGHSQLYEMINSGLGPAASEPQSSYWKGLTEELGQVDETLNKKLTDMGASWEGQAAESAQSGLTPLAAWASDAESGSSVMQTSAELQADYISDARAQMPEPVEVTTPAPSGWQMAAAAAGALTGNPGPAVAVASQAADHEAQESAQNEAEQKAVQTMQTYESSSTWNRDTLGTFVAPPDVVIATPAPQGGTPGAVAPVASHAGPHAQGSTQSTSSSSATVPTGNGTNSPTGTLVPHGGTTQPPSTQVPPGGSVSAPPAAATTPSGVLPATAPPPVTTQPGPGVPTPTLNTGNPLPSNTNTVLPTFGNTNTKLPVGEGPLTGGNRGPIIGGNRVTPFEGGGRGPVEGGTRGPLTGGTRGPLTGGPGENAGNVARRGVPLRGGLPGAAGLEADGVRSNSPFRGGAGAGGAVPGESAAVRGRPGAASAAGGRGAAEAGARRGVNGPMGAGGRRADGEDEDERFAPNYLLETEDVFGDDRRVSPTVIGEPTPEQ